ncbi:MAG TPA: hypothetical protein VKY53_09775 [Marinobacter sp.]|nr:hypothetical protein [Marinobacter sp.]
MMRRAGFVMALMAAGSVHAELQLAATPLADSELAMLRGGFVLEGLEINIGLEQLVTINGDRLVINRVTIPDLNQALAGARELQQVASVLAMEPVDLAGLSVTSDPMSAGGWMTAIQNTLDSTTIQHIRTLNIELNNVGAAYRYPRDTGFPLLP